MTDSADRALTRALAGAFLAGEWQPDGLFDRGAQVLGGRRRWLRPLTHIVLAAYRDPPRDRPRELAAFIATTRPVVRAVDAARRQGRSLPAVALLTAPTRMAPSRWPVAPLDDVAALAALLDTDLGHLGWYADTSAMQRRASDDRLHLYRYRWLARPGRVPRLIEIPRPRLRAAQRALLQRVVGLIPAHAAAHGFVRGRSARSGASPHVGADVVISLDLVAFFASVGAGRVYGILRSAGYPEDVAHTLTGICSTATPVRVLAAMPPGGTPEQRFRLRRRLAAPHLPQGAPTSPHLANLCAHPLDRRLAGYAQALGATYTRYADDLTVSGGPAVGRRADAVAGGIARIVTAEGFTVNPSKTRIRSRAERQTVTGIVVNECLNVPRAEYDRLRAILHNAVRTGPQAQNREDHPDLRAHLEGRISWVDSLNPSRGQRLRAEFARIQW